MRQTSSGCRCSSTDWFGWNGGSNQNQRSVGKSASMLHVGDQEAVAEASGPCSSSPSSPRTGLRAPSAATSQSRAAVVAVGRLDLEFDAVAMLGSTPTTLFFQRSSKFGSCSRALEQVSLDVVLLEVDEGRALVARPRAAG